jgi:hypothetical protein
MRDIAADATALKRHITNKMHCARRMGILEEDNNNWYGFMMTIGTPLLLDIQQYLCSPLPTELFVAYLGHVDQC